MEEGVDDARHPAGKPPPPAGFVDFYKNRYRELVRAAMYFGANEDEAHDAAQAAMLEVLLRWERIDEPYAYARTTAINHFIKHRTQTRNLHLRLLERGHATPDKYDQSSFVTEDQGFVSRLLGKLPEAQRQVMSLMYDGYDTKEIADRLGKTAANVRQLRRLGRTHLRAIMEQRREPSLSSQEETPTAHRPALGKEVR